VKLDARGLAVEAKGVQIVRYHRGRQPVEWALIHVVDTGLMPPVVSSQSS